MTGSITVSCQLPFLCAVDVLHHASASLQVRHTPTDTHPVVSKDDGHSPPSVHTVPTSKVRDTVLLAEANTFLKELKFFWQTTFSVANPHIPDGRLQDAVYSHMSVHTTPASQSGPAPSLTLSRRQSG